MTSMESEKMTSAHVANHVLWLAEKFRVKDMTCLKLMKILYISYAWHLCVFDKEMFSECPQAWKFGPVFPSIYHALSIAEDQPIEGCVAISEPGKKNEDDFPVIRADDEDTLSIVENAFYMYKDKTSEELSEVTHRAGGAWDAAIKKGLYSDLDDRDLIKKGASEGIEKYINRKKSPSHE